MLLLLRLKQKLVKIRQRITSLANIPIFASTTATVDVSSWQDALQKLIEILKPIYDALYSFFGNLWNFLSTGTTQDIIVKAVVIGILSLGVAVFAGKISEFVKYFIYGVAIAVILVCLAAVLKAFGIVKL